MTDFIVFTGEHNDQIITVCVSPQTLSEEGGKAENFFLSGTTKITNRGTCQCVGDGANWLPDWFECKD